MAFVVQERWTVGTTEFAFGGRLNLLHSRRAGQASRSVIALIATMLVHAGLLLLVVLHLFGEQEDARAPGSASTPMLMFDLAQMPPSSSTPISPVAVASAPPSPSLTHPTTAQAPEWKTALVRVPVMSSAPAFVPVATLAATQPSSPAKAGAGITGNYDPYAGASPNRREESASHGTTPFTSVAELKRRAMVLPHGSFTSAQQFVAIFKSRHASARGQTEVRVLLAPDETVVRVIDVRGSLTPELIEALRLELPGNRITAAGFQTRVNERTIVIQF